MIGVSFWMMETEMISFNIGQCSGTASSNCNATSWCSCAISWWPVLWTLKRDHTITVTDSFPNERKTFWCLFFATCAQMQASWDIKHRGVYVTLPQHGDKLKSKNRLDFLWYAVTVKTLSSEVLEYFGIVISFYSPWLDLTHQQLSGLKEQWVNKMLYKDAVWQCKKSQFDTRLDPPPLHGSSFNTIFKASIFFCTNLFIINCINIIIIYY